MSLHNLNAISLLYLYITNTYIIFQIIIYCTFIICYTKLILKATFDDVIHVFLRFLTIICLLIIVSITTIENA